MPAPLLLHAMRLDELSVLELTYGGVGGTRWRATPAGFHAAEHRSVLGSDHGRFDRAVDALLHWRMHDAAGLRMQATGPVAVGVDSLGRLGVGRFAVPVPCRVVWVVREPDRVGFGYGSLPGHPASGEESFVLERVAGEVVFTVRAFSRGAQWYTRCGAPLARSAQRAYLRRYAGALRRLSAD
ncbi:MAG TPA: DUF1990 domain-containing protein [Nocardioidaceae bacterium]|nr:DUF1990 domain-containing protein [Nocardioidaceae bacterium]